MLVVLAGMPGVGKSTLARALAKHLGAIVLDKDQIRDGIFPPAEVDYSDPQNALATDVVYLVAAYILKRDPGKLIVLDGKPYSREAQRQEARSLAQRTGSRFRLIHCVAPDEVVRRRLEQAAAKDSQTLIADRTFAKYLRIKEAFEPIATEHLVVDTTDAIDRQVEACSRYLGAPGARA